MIHDRRRSLRSVALQAHRAHRRREELQWEAEQKASQEAEWRRIVDAAARQLVRGCGLDPDQIRVRPLPAHKPNDPSRFDTIVVEFHVGDVRLLARDDGPWSGVPAKQSVNVYYAEECQKLRCQTLVPVGRPISCLEDIGERVEQAIQDARRRPRHCLQHLTVPA